MKTRKYFAAILVVLAVGFMGCEQPSGGTGGDHNQTLTPTAADFTISGTGTFTYDGNPKTVIVTAKDGKTKGKITVKYDGKTTAPSAVGKYPVTFDVAAASGWNAATGLSAGTLTINAAIQGNRTPTAADYDIGNLTQTAGSVTAVTVTPKEGKSTGAVTIFYNGSTTLPTTVGTYAVTFNVAAVTNWNPATGLSAGNLDIGSPAYPTPVADDYIIGYLSQMFGSISAVTVTPKEDKSTGMVTVRYNNSTTVPSAVGTYTVTFEVAAVSGWNAASGLSAGTLTINPKVITFTIDTIPAQTYTGSAITPTVTIKDGSTTLSLTSDYTLAYNNNTNVGTATITVDGTGNYAGSSGNRTFIINPKVTTFTIDAIPMQDYTGSAITPAVTVKDGTTTLTLNTHYTLSYSNNTNAGTATVTVSGVGNYIGSTGSTTFTINDDPTIPYVITGSGTSFTATRNNVTIGTANQPIQTVIDAIRTHAVGNARTIQFGNGTAILDIGTDSVSFNNTGGTWGAITLTGKITSSDSNSSYGTIVIADAVSVTSTADIENAGPSSLYGYAVFHNSTGTVTFSGGTTRSPHEAVHNNSTGTINISGGTVSATSGHAVVNKSTGAVNISHGTVSATNGAAVYNYSDGKITVSGTAKVTSIYYDDHFGTIYLGNSGTSTAVRLEITGGTVENITPAPTKFTPVYNFITIYNDSTGAVLISGGTVSATAGSAVYNNSTGKITVSGTAKVTSEYESFFVQKRYGTISNESTGRIEISGGTIENTANFLNAVTVNNRAGLVTISGGTVSATTGYAVCNTPPGQVSIYGGTIIGKTEGF